MGNDQHGWGLSSGALWMRPSSLRLPFDNPHACWLQLGTDCYLLRFRFDTQATCDGVWGLLLALLVGEKEVRHPHPECDERKEHCTNDHLVKQCFFYHGASSWFFGFMGIGLLGNAGGNSVGKGQLSIAFLQKFFNGSRIFDCYVWIDI